jgi:hypothetical protein
MKDAKTTAQIQSMNIGEKIAALSEPDKAYVSGYVDRAMIEYHHRRRDYPAGNSQNTR